MDLQIAFRNRVRVVIWETTRACRLACMHCVIGAQQRRSPLELSTYEAYKLIDQVSALAPDELLMTGGDPLERDDLFQLIDYAARRGVRPTLELSATAGLSGFTVARLRRSGLATAALSLDASAPGRHDAVRGVTGGFATTLLASRWARTAGLEVEINTLVSRRNLDDLETIANFAGELNASRWNVFFHVPVGESKEMHALTAADAESAFSRLFALSEKVPFAIRAFEAPQYGRYTLQKGLEATDQTLEGYLTSNALQNVAIGRSAMDRVLTDRMEVLFVSHTGEVTVSPFLPLSAGNVRYHPLKAIYRSSDLLVALRDDRNLKGKCGRCEYRSMCGGSRARAFAMTGDVFACDPLCGYEPGLGAGAPTLIAQESDR